MDQGAKAVFFHDVIRDGPHGDVHIFILAGVIERGDQVEISQIEAEEGGVAR